jgi:ATP-dependent helicase HrpA
VPDPEHADSSVLNPVAIHYPDLPVSAARARVLAALARHQVLVLCGETGSGKTTQIPKMCLEAGLAAQGLVGCTQPRRLAARTVASRVAEELRVPLGGLVGYKVRFTDRIGAATRLKFMTDGILLAETQSDPLLSAYSCLVIDEAHERSLNIDFLLGLLAGLVHKRPELRVVITSATLDAARFSAHFGGAPVIEVSGRTYPVELRYRPIEAPPRHPEAKTRPQDAAKAVREEESQLARAIVDATHELAREGLHDTLIFLPGEREIRDMAELLRREGPPHCEILPLYSRLSTAAQDRIFKPDGGRRIVLATNVAETSLTVPGICSVIDPGLARVKRYSARNKVEQLLVEKVSQAAAAQRAGRCGRLGPGVCIRLYDAQDFAARPAYTDPELLRSSLAGVVLRMKSLGLGDVGSFPFVDPPPPRLVADGLRQLHELGALDASQQLTPLGRQMARLPLDPRIGRMLLAASTLNCVSEVLILAAFLAVQDPRERPPEKAQAADEKHREFVDPRSDFLGVLRLWQWVETAQANKTGRRDLEQQFAARFLSVRRLREWREVHGQLLHQAEEFALTLNQTPASYEALHQALLTGLLGNLGFKVESTAQPPVRGGPRDKPGAYQGARGLRFALHPGSALARKQPKWVMVAELADTGRLLGRMAAEIRPDWVERAAAHLLDRSYTEPHWDAKSGYVMAYEKTSLYGLTLAARRPVHYGPIDPETAREVFIRAALVAGDFAPDADWQRHNRALVREIEDMEHKARKSGLWLDEARIEAFFDARIPPQVHNAPAFFKWIKHADAGLLRLRREDVLAEGLDLGQGLYPEHLDIDGVRCAIKYRFEPGHPLDGATLALPLHLLNRVAAAQLDWAIPGLLREQVAALVKLLPKPVRQALIPQGQAITQFLSQVAPGEQPLAEALARWASGRVRAEVSVPDRHALPLPLKLNVRVLDDRGEELGMGRELGELRARFSQSASLAYDGGARQDGEARERQGLTDWSFGDLRESLEFSRGGQTLTGYPALVDETDSVALRLLDSAAAAERANRRGVVRLLRIALAPQFKQFEKDYSRLAALVLKYRPYGHTEALVSELLDSLAQRAGLGDDPVPHTQQAFVLQRDRARARLAAVSQALVKNVEICLDLAVRVQPRLAQPGLPAAVRQDIEHQLARLVYPGFIRETPWVAFGHLPRYLEGMLRRLDKLASAGDRDARHMAQVQSLEKRWQERLARHRKSGVACPVLSELRWQHEELRVSLFAQELKTPGPVSAKRLEKLWERVAP